MTSLLVHAMDCWPVLATTRGLGFTVNIVLGGLGVLERFRPSSISRIGDRS